MASATRFVARLIVCGFLLSVSQMAAADHYQDESDHRDGARRALTIDDAAQAAERRYPGSRVLRAGSGGGEGPHMYEIRVLTPNGRVRTMVVDPQSGKVSE